MRKIGYVLAVLSCVLLLGCGEENVGEQPKTTVTMETVGREDAGITEVEVELEAEESTEQEPVSDEEELVDREETKEEAETLFVESAAQLIKNMKVGWNLGNTMDSEGKLETS